MIYKYIILFIVFLANLHSKPLYGQFGVAFDISTYIPSSAIKNDYHTGYGAGIMLNRTFDVHQVFVHASFQSMKGRAIADQFVEYKNADIWSFPLNIGYAYQLWSDFSRSDLSLYTEAGPWLVKKPQSSLGANGVVGVKYRYRSVSFGMNITHLRHDGYINLYGGHLSYQLF